LQGTVIFFLGLLIGVRTGFFNIFPFWAVLWIRICIHFGRLDPDPGGPKVIHKSEEISSFEVLNVVFCGMKISPVTWFKEK
jgi:hypothetical protein